MVISSWARLCLLCAAVVLSTSLYAVTPDRIQGPLGGGPKIALKGNVHGYAKPENDIGRAEGSRPIEGLSLTFRPSPQQQKDLDNFLAELGDPASPNYHKYLTPKQFGERFGMSTNDLNKVSAWLESEGFTNVKVANGRNEISFDGTVAQVESTFGLEMHHYLVDGVVHLANAGEPYVPAALSGTLLYIGHLNTFAPKPRAKVIPHLTSYVNGSHYLTPGDFATIYDLDGLGDGSGQKIAVVGQSTVSTTDLNNFRNAAGLSSSTVTMTRVPNTSTDMRCTGDEGESDLDLEWSGGVAKQASIIFLYAGMNLAAGDSCGGNRTYTVWDALHYAVLNNIAPFISISYGFCESGLPPGFPATVEGWAVQGQTQGQTIVAAAGDAGAADCDSAIPAINGLAVDVPASIPEVTGVGGNEFFGDAAGAVTGTAPNTTAGATQYWAASGTGSDSPISTALGYIPEEAWNDTSQTNTLSASGGGESTLFPKKSWQTGAGFPPGANRDVPDISVAASPNHDGYLFCSEDDGNGGTVSTCTSGFGTGGGGGYTVVGGTSVGPPTYSAILALINQFAKNTPPTGLAPINPVLYSTAAKTPAAFHDVTTGNNIVSCQQLSPGCPSTAPFQYGFSAGTGYDQVTGLGSVDGFVLAQAMSNGPGFSLAVTPTSYQVAQGSGVPVTVNLKPINGFTGNVTYTCSDSVPESTCTGPATAVPSSQPASFRITTTAPTARLERPFDGGTKIFYATLLPGLLGIVLVGGARRGPMRGVRFLGLLMLLGFSTLGVTSCGGSSSTKDPGTPPGTYSITVTGTATINGSPVNRSVSIQLVVVP